MTTDKVAAARVIPWEEDTDLWGLAVELRDGKSVAYVVGTRPFAEMERKRLKGGERPLCGPLMDWDDEALCRRRLLFRFGTDREETVRGWTSLLAVLAIAGFAATGASAQEKIRLAQSSVTTTCMMTCNAQYANCQSSCLATGTPNLPGANVSASQSCLASCTNQQLQCQITCARASPSR